MFDISWIVNLIVHFEPLLIKHPTFSIVISGTISISQCRIIDQTEPKGIIPLEKANKQPIIT